MTLQEKKCDVAGIGCTGISLTCTSSPTLLGRRAAAGSRAAVEPAARAPGRLQHPPARPLAHTQLAVAAGRLPAGSVWGDAGDRVAASRTPELPLPDTSPQDRCVDRGAGVRNRVRMPGLHPILSPEGSAGCGQMVNMHFQGVGLCLSLLFITVNAEFMNDGVEVEDLNENSEESNIKEDESSSGTIKYKTPQPIGEVYFTETFDSGKLAGWVLSKAKKDDMDSEISIYDGRWEIEELKEDQVPGDRGLVLKSKAKHHAISAVLAKPFVFSDKPLVVQLEYMLKHGLLLVSLCC
ncbi:calmegin-like [Peromyscus maniculatus bairdii]|uniref:calmegin-like n=1 Tax=Peromyscus maniculatus bairdii TaxID=230844 RepID=UPI003FD5B1F2